MNKIYAIAMWIFLLPLNIIVSVIDLFTNGKASNWLYEGIK